MIELMPMSAGIGIALGINMWIKFYTKALREDLICGSYSRGGKNNE